MEATTFLLQFWGWLLVILSLVYLLRGKNFTDELVKLTENEAFAPLSGYIALIVGLTSVILYNEWAADRMLVVTVLGWLSVVKGIVRIGCPKAVQRIAKGMKDRGGLIYGLLVIALIVGLWLLWL